MTSNENMSDVRALDIDTFCRKYSIGRTMTYAEIKAGRLKTAKIGKKRLIPSEAAEEWFKQKYV